MKNDQQPATIEGRTESPGKCQSILNQLIQVWETLEDYWLW